MSEDVPASLRPPVERALTKAINAIPAEDALPSGCRYEPKWDGCRASISVSSTGASLWSRQGKDLSHYFPELLQAAEAQIPTGCVLDGKAVIWAGDRLDFDVLSSPSKAHNQDFAAFGSLQATCRRGSCALVYANESSVITDLLEFPREFQINFPKCCLLRVIGDKLIT
jgi:ATP-dependent DNA ligase